MCPLRHFCKTPKTYIQFTAVSSSCRKTPSTPSIYVSLASDLSMFLIIDTPHTHSLLKYIDLFFCFFLRVLVFYCDGQIDMAIRSMSGFDVLIAEDQLFIQCLSVHLLNCPSGAARHEYSSRYTYRVHMWQQLSDTAYT